MSLSDEYEVRALGASDRRWLVDFMIERWGADAVVRQGQVFTPSTLAGFVAQRDDRRAGVITYVLSDAGCEIVTLDSTIENVGIGTALIQAIEAVARAHAAARLWLTTTNDNLRALGFYQRRGFRIVRVDGGAVARARRLKPGIPLVGQDGIPIRDELVLQREL